MLTLAYSDHHNSLFGSQNWEEGVELTGMNRTINRRKFVRSELEVWVGARML